MDDDAGARSTTREEKGAIVAVIDAGKMDGKIDGRRARSLRTRDAVMDALWELVTAGDVAPTAQRIADQAGVSVRSVYQHFVDVEGLYAEATTRAFATVRSESADVDPSVPLARRLDAFADERAALLEWLVPFHRAARLVEATSERVRAQRAAMERWERERVATTFAPELRAAARARRGQLLAMLDALTSADVWDHLRRNGQSARGARQIMREGIACVIGAG